jgi:hypothetical protein
MNHLSPASYELLASESSPVALLVLGDGGQVIRHANRKMASLLGAPGAPDLAGRYLAEVAPVLEPVLRPLLDAVADCGRPRRVPGSLLPLPDLSCRDTSWDVACALLPADPAFAPPEIIALWLWPEDVGTVSSRRVAEALGEALHAPPASEIPGFELASALVPSEPGAALGGDTYDVVAVGDGRRWALLMADVSGRGPAAAARAVMVRHSVHVLAQRHGPGDTLTQLSRLMLADPSFTGFVTAFLGVVDPGSATLTYVTAGHEPALLLRGDTGTVQELAGDGALPLAVDEEPSYREQTVPLTPRDTLLLYTDGLTDTRRGRHDREFWGEDRVRAALVQQRHLPAPALVARLLTDAAAWAGGGGGAAAGAGVLRDDTALLVLRGEDA